MSRYSRKDVDHAASELAKILGISIAIEAYSPGDRHGTRYRIHVEGDKPHTLGRCLTTGCGAGSVTEAMWHMIYGIREYKRYNEAPASDATAQLQDLEAQ